MNAAQNESVDIKPSGLHQSASLSMLLIYLVGLGPTSFQMFLPAVPSLASDFGVSAAVANLTVSLSMLSFAIAALVYGSLSQRIESKMLLLVGMSILVLGSVLCLFAPSVEWVIVGRIIQPLGGASGVVIARLIVADLIDEKHSANLMSKLAASMMISPLLGVPLGGYLTEYFGWQSVFVFILTASCLALVLVSVILEKSRKKAVPSEQKNQNLLKDYFSLLRNRVFMGNSGHFSFSQAALMCFLSASPLVLSTLFQMGASDISLTLIIVSISAVAGNMIAPRLPESISVNQRLLGGSVVAFIGGVVAMVTVGFGYTSVFLLVAPVMVFSFCNGIASPVSQMKAIQADAKRSGTASGFSMFLSMFVASIATQVVSNFNTGNEFVVALPLFLFTSLALVSVVAIIRVSSMTKQ
ncbi:multidrug effflux MFS transporter [Vibrio coralliilyticus]|uniref:multidrug effflux MFS transporter n=1 Tax=Vibrio coralliilyticus TaxID=190893 RepID=UPI000C169A66|nr:multidrug effflux MFS transporter [Vibrio coralliilyticus]